jgi:hypothetical protein
VVLALGCTRSRPELSPSPVVWTNRIFAPRTDRPPRIDGDLEDWGEGPVSDAFIDPRRGLTAVSTLRMHARWDERNLYLALENDEPAELEVMLQPDVTRREHREVRISASGATSGMPATAAMRGSRVELAVPLGRGVAVGERWGLNVFRRTKAGAIGAVWSKPLAVDLQAVDQCGDLIFADEQGEDPSLAAEEEEEEQERREAAERRMDGTKRRASRVSPRGRAPRGRAP